MMEEEKNEKQEAGENEEKEGRGNRKSKETEKKRDGEVVEAELITVEHPSSLYNQDSSTSITTTTNSFSNGLTSPTSSPSLAFVSSSSLILHLLELIGSVLFYYNHPSQKKQFVDPLGGRVEKCLMKLLRVWMDGKRGNGWRKCFNYFSYFCVILIFIYILTHIDVFSALFL
jgi:hypothetical protein